jgi:hypothetical protein
MANIIQANDSLIKRNRTGRALVFFGTPVVLALLGGTLVSFLAHTFIGVAGVSSIGLIVGIAAGLISFLAIKHFFVVQNDTTGLLITLDQLKSLFQGQNGKPVHVVYGPGTHFSYPWEARFARNNIPVTETTEEFEFTAICSDGTLKGKGSFRLRPDFENPINYLSGVGAVAGDLKDLIIAFINAWLAKKTMQEGLDEQDKLYTALHERFIKASEKTPFEVRFGVQLGDITVSQLLMSDETQRTRGAINEANVIAQGTAILLGYRSEVRSDGTTLDAVQCMQSALAAKAITQDDIDRARREFRIISGNMDGASVNRYEVDIKGLTPEVAGALAAVLNNPAARALAGNTSRNTGGKPRRGNQK